MTNGDANKKLRFGQNKTLKPVFFFTSTSPPGHHCQSVSNALGQSETQSYP